MADTDTVTAKTLPPEVMTHVLSFLDARGLSLAGCCCRQWHEAATDQHLWRNLCVLRGWNFQKATTSLERTDWKSLYVSRHLWWRGEVSAKELDAAGECILDVVTDSNKLLMTTQCDGPIKVSWWDMTTLLRTTSFTLPWDNDRMTPVISLDADVAVYVDNVLGITCWSLETDQLLFKETPCTKRITAVAIRGHLIATFTLDNGIKIRSISTGLVLSNFNMDFPSTEPYLFGLRRSPLPYVSCIEISCDGRHVIGLSDENDCHCVRQSSSDDWSVCDSFKLELHKEVPSWYEQEYKKKVRRRLSSHISNIPGSRGIYSCKDHTWLCADGDVDVHLSGPSRVSIMRENKILRSVDIERSCRHLAVDTSSGSIVTFESNCFHFTILKFQ